MISVLAESLKSAILAAYASISRANQHILAEVNQDVKMQYQGTASINARIAITSAAPLIEAARKELIRFLGAEGSG
jgi:hypothetical protein